MDGSSAQSDALPAVFWLFSCSWSAGGWSHSECHPLPGATASRPCMTTESISDIVKETRCESRDQLVSARIHTTASRVPICVLQALTVELLSTESRGQAKIKPSFPSDIHDIVG